MCTELATDLDGDLDDQLKDLYRDILETIAELDNPLAHRSQRLLDTLDDRRGDH